MGRSPTSPEVYMGTHGMKRARDYQLGGVRYGSSRRHAAWFWDMRLGKCLVAIRTAKAWGVMLSLVVCPDSAMDGWTDELEDEGETSVYRLVGTRPSRLRKLVSATGRAARTWCVINKEGWLHLPEVGQVTWDLVVADESIFLAQPRSKVTKFFTGKRVRILDPDTRKKTWVRSRFGEAGHRALLTGDPEPNSKLDYFTQLEFLDPSILGVRSYWDFRLMAFKPVGFEWQITPRGRRWLAERLAQSCSILKKKDVGLGTERIREKRTLALPPALARQYRTVEREFVLEARGRVLSKTIFAGVAWNWMRRLCGGFTDKKFVWDGKCKELLYLAATELKGEQVIVWCHYVNEIHRVSEALTGAGVTNAMLWREVPKQRRSETVEAFRRGDIQDLVVQPDLYKHGADFSCASTMVYYSQCSGSETRNQTEARCERVGKDDGTLIVDLLVEDSVDEELRESQRLRENDKQLFRRLIRRIEEGGHNEQGTV